VDPYTVPTRYWHRLDDGRVQCDLCPRECRLHEGQRGLCFVRARRNNAIVLTSYGRSSGLCVDPIEKKPLNHFLPGSAVLSFGTAGCNLACRFCQNWDISKSREFDTLADAAAPEAGYPDVAVPHAAADVASPEAAAADTHVSDAVVPSAVASGAEHRTGRHAAVDTEDVAEQAQAAAGPAGRPTIHLPLDDPYQVPDGYPIKASARFGLYYTPGSELYHDTLAEIWLASEEVAQANGFIKAD